MKVVVSYTSKMKIGHTARFIQSQFGQKARLEFNERISQALRLLSGNPKLGPVEPLLEGQTIVYRSIVIGHLNKIIYWVNTDVIEIVDFWDTRREPNTQRDQMVAQIN